MGVEGEGCTGLIGEFIQDIAGIGWRIVDAIGFDCECEGELLIAFFPLFGVGGERKTAGFIGLSAGDVGLSHGVLTFSKS